MTLTGQCSKDFNEWYLSQDFSKQGQYEYGQRKALNMFNAMMLPFRWGVYVDFFDSVGLRIGVSPVFENDFWVYLNDEEINDIDFKTRPEARTAAIKKANEIYNAQ